MMRPLSVCFVLLFSMLAFATVACAGNRAWTEADDWYKPDKDQGDAADRKPVKLAEVKAAALADAEKRLVDSDFVPLTADESQALADHPPAKAGKNELYLVRAVYLNRGTGAFDVTYDDKTHDLYVRHGSLGHHAVKMKRQPLIVALPQPPEHVYVTASMAE